MAKVQSNKRLVCLITGIAGFCGSHLADHLLALGHRVVGIEVKSASLTNIDPFIDQIELFWADIRDSVQINRILSEILPNRIYHLAAINKSGVNHNYREIYEINVCGTINLLDCINENVPDSRVLIAGSSAQYGFVKPEESPIVETHPLHPLTPYGVSKATQDLVAYTYWVTRGLHIVRTRAFNIIGIRQSLSLAGSAFAHQVAEIEEGLRAPVILVGNLEAQRDFVDVRDAVRAYQLALENGEPGAVYNVCSGQAHSIRALLDYMLAMSRVRGIKIQQDPSLLQSTDVPVQVGNYVKLCKKTGWQPEITFEQSVNALLDYWRERSRTKAK
jgi:GDP-4-dehydro-6-deoxy-D-mannose reductase